MKLTKPLALLATAEFLLAVALLLPGEVRAQPNKDTKDSSGGAPTATPTPKKPMATLTPSPGQSQGRMDAMPGMPPKATPGAAAPAEMADMPGKDPKDPAAPPRITPTPKLGVATPQNWMDAMPGMPSKPTPTPIPAAAQSEMDAMPGMAPKPTPTPKPAAAQSEMDAMPGMAPGRPAVGKLAPKPAMDAMPGMAPGGAAAKKGMAGMPGMAPSNTAGKKGKKDMAAMPGMPASDGSAPMSAMGAAGKVSTPGVTILGPSQKWVPPKGEDRSAELLGASELDRHLKDLPPPLEDSKTYHFFLFELLEYRGYNKGPAALTWDFVGWVGGDYNRLWVNTEGDLNLARGNGVQADLQILYGRLIAPNWDFQLGARFNGIMEPGRSRRSRAYAVLGFQGLAPGNFDFEPSLYISTRGEVAAQLTVSADLYLTQRLVLQPRVEVQASVQGDRQFGTRPGLNQTDIGVRMRYEFRREIAPYIGVSWVRKYGGTASLSRGEGDPVSSAAFVVGLRLFF